MEKTRQSLPEGLAEMPPGPALAAVLDSIDLSRLSGSDCVEVMRVRHRQASHEQARLMAAMVEVGLCGIGPDDELPRMDCPDEFAADEIRGALAWTRSAAGGQLGLAWDLMHRLRPVFEALDRGSIDVPKARVFSEWTDGLTDEQAHRICDRLLPEAPRLTTGRLSERIKKMAIALDPDWARRKYEDAVRQRKVVGYRNEDGTGNLCGYQLPADRAAAACAHIDSLAKKIKQAGDSRPIDHIKADLYLGLLDGSYVGWSETCIIGHMLANAAATEAQAAEHHDAGENDRDDPSGDEGRGVVRRLARPDGRSCYDRRGDQDAHGPNAHRPGDQRSVTEESDGPSPSADGGPARRAGVEIRAEVTTLLGLDDHPAEIAGWGHVHAELARALVREQTGAEWRYALTDDDGRLLYEGITRRRPHDYPARSGASARGGIVELQIALSVLRRLVARSARLGGWASVIADLARQADQHEQSSTDAGDQGTGGQGSGVQRRERGGRSPGRVLRRRTQIRDRTCTHPGCRAPAAGTDGDHTRDWADGGPTRDENIGSLCRHDHRVKHEGGWQVEQLRPGHFLWTSRLGRRYHVRPPLIIQPLPDPTPREPITYRRRLPGYDLDGDNSDEEDDVPTWCEPSVRPAPAVRPSAKPDPADAIPPF